MVKPVLWPGHTEDEQRVITLLHAAFGTITRISREAFNTPWVGVTQATTPRCPDCGTFWKHEEWPRCGWCHFRDV